jgi:hypothetical protein
MNNLLQSLVLPTTIFYALKDDAGPSASQQTGELHLNLEETA